MKNDKFKHCFISCNVTKDFGIALTLTGGFAWEADQARTDKPKRWRDYLEDFTADAIGAGFGSASHFMPCDSACELVYPDN